MIRLPRAARRAFCADCAPKMSRVFLGLSAECDVNVFFSIATIRLGASPMVGFARLGLERGRRRRLPVAHGHRGGADFARGAIRASGVHNRVHARADYADPVATKSRSIEARARRGAVSKSTAFARSDAFLPIGPRCPKQRRRQSATRYRRRRPPSRAQYAD